MTSPSSSYNGNEPIPVITVTRPNEGTDHCEAASATSKYKFNLGTPRYLLSEDAFPKMIKNMGKAICEHRFNQPNERDIYIEMSDLPLINLSLKNTPLTCSFSSSSDVGGRDSLDDASFFKEIRQGYIAGVFDGHFGDKVAIFANRFFQDHFEEILKLTNGNVHQALEMLIDDFQNEVVANSDYFGCTGSTAVISFIDKTTHLVYTATLGDSEANIYRDDSQGQKMSIPLSCVRNWGSAKDVERLGRYFGKPQKIAEWKKTPDPKSLRITTIFDRQYRHLNVSRALGDVPFIGTRHKPGVVHKSKITVTQLYPGDLVVWACDGLKDFVNERDICCILTNTGGDPAQNLVSFALIHGHCKDNVTVVVMTVC